MLLCFFLPEKACKFSYNTIKMQAFRLKFFQSPAGPCF